MVSTLEVYRDFASLPGRQLRVEDLEARGLTRNHAQTLLSRLKKSGLAYSDGRNRVKLLLATESAPAQTREDPVVLEMIRRGAKATGFTVLPHRYPGARPREFVAPSGKIKKLADFIATHHGDLVVENGYQANEFAVCIYSGPVRGNKASTEEALVHVFRHAPRGDFALALQAVLMESTKLNWHWLRGQPEWGEFAGIFLAVNEIAGRDVFPRFHAAQLPSLSYDELETVAQAVTAKGSSRGD